MNFTYPSFRHNPVKKNEEELFLPFSWSQFKCLCKNFHDFSSSTSESQLFFLTLWIEKYQRCLWRTMLKKYSKHGKYFSITWQKKYFSIAFSVKSNDDETTRRSFLCTFTRNFPFHIRLLICVAKCLKQLQNSLSKRISYLFVDTMVMQKVL